MRSAIRLTRPAFGWCVGLVVWLAVSACDSRREGPVADTTTATTPAVPAPGGAMTASRLDDPQIAHVAVTANSIDSAFGELAKTKAQSAVVRTLPRQWSATTAR